MEKKNKKLPIIIGIIALVVVIAVIVIVVILNKGHRVIKIESFAGDVELERGSDEEDVFEGMKLKSDDKVTTGDASLVELLVDEDKHIVAEENTCFTIVANGNEKKGKLKIELEYGTSLIDIENKLSDDSDVEVETPNATLSVRGTTFEVGYTEDENTTVVEVTTGTVEVETDGTSEMVDAGNMAIIVDDEIKIMSLPIQYRETSAFDVRYSSTKNYSGVIVKELVGWTTVTRESDSEQPDQFENKGVIIRYWMLTEDEVNDEISMAGEQGALESLDYRKNDDGDTMICAKFDLSGQNGDIEIAYQYYKEIQDNMYLSILVCDRDGGVSLGDADIETYLPLTNDCYYMY